MSETELLKPDLYASDGTPDVPDRPALLGGVCVCGHTFFPMQTYGCEMCGRTGDALRPARFSGRGTLIASVEVHMHAARGGGDSLVEPLEAPFTIGTIKLDDGPTVRTLLTDIGNEDLTPGRTMVTTLVPVGRDSASILDLRFTPDR